MQDKLKKRLEKRAGRSVRVCDTLFSKAIGFMFSFQRDCALLFVFPRRQRVSVHTFFCFFPLCVEWLDKSGRVVEKKVMRPFSFYTPSRACNYVLEVPV